MNKPFSQRLGRTIDATGLNPTQFARRANIPQGTISKCLNGHVPTARILLRISRLTGKSVDWLLLGKEHKGGAGYVAESPARYGRAGKKAKCVGAAAQNVRGEHRHQYRIWNTEKAQRRHKHQYRANRYKTDDVAPSFFQFFNNTFTWTPRARPGPHEHERDDHGKITEPVDEEADAFSRNSDDRTGNGWSDQSGPVHHR